MQLARLFLIAPALLATAFAGGCGTQTTVSSWSAQTPPGAPFRRILVIGVLDNVADRTAFEHKFADRLGRRGIEAVPSVSVAGDDKFDRERLEALVERTGTDAVLISDLTGVEEQEVHHPPRTYTVPRTHYMGGYYGYYHTVWEQVREPGYTSRHTVVRLETNLYVAADESLAWSARSRTLDPPSALDAMDSVIDALIQDLAAKGLLP